MKEIFFWSSPPFGELEQLASLWKRRDPGLLNPLLTSGALYFCFGDFNFIFKMKRTEWGVVDRGFSLESGCPMFKYSHITLDKSLSIFFPCLVMHTTFKSQDPNEIMPMKYHLSVYSYLQNPSSFETAITNFQFPVNG